MSRPDKIASLKQLEAAFEAWKVKKGLQSGWGTFLDMYTGGASVASMAFTFRMNRRTMEKRINNYERITGVHRDERTNGKAIAKN